jgi:hypothetical protein
MSSSGLHNQKRTETTVESENKRFEKDALLITEYNALILKLVELVPNY